MRRASITPQLSLGQNEPVIVVEDDEDKRSPRCMSRQQSEDVDSPMHNPYLLSPWRDPRETRKHSLPTPACTSGITASQVRRLSEQGGENSGPSAREQDFLATLYSAPAPKGRRHSVVTISKVPPTLFGRNRRESVAAFPSISKSSSRSLLSNRRESVSSIGGASGGPPAAGDHHGSIHNLQLDIMDDIVTARKVRMKMWNTSNEKVCEVQPIHECASSASPTVRYTQQGGALGSRDRRFSDFVGTTLAPIPSSNQKRRASELPPIIQSAATSGLARHKLPNAGIVCTNTDLISILSNLTSSATEINQCGLKQNEVSLKSDPPTAEQKRNKLKTIRSNSFDVSVLHSVKIQEPSGSSEDPKNKSIASDGAASWFIKRHQPMSKKDGSIIKKQHTVTFLQPKPSEKETKKIVWDEKSATTIDADAIGSAIEGFLRRGVSSPCGSLDSPSSPIGTAIANTGVVQSKGAIPKTTKVSTITSTVASTSPSSSKVCLQKTASSSSNWFSGSGKTTTQTVTTTAAPTTEEDANNESCDTSLCSTLKDLFVK